MAIQLRLKQRLLIEFNKKHDYSWIKDITRYGHNEERIVDIDITRFSSNELSELEVICEADSSSNAKNNLRQIRNFNAFANDFSGTKVVKKLISFPSAFKAYLKNLPNKWIFVNRSDGEFLPYFANDVTYSPPYKDKDGYFYEAFCRLELLAYRNGSKTTTTYTFYPQHMGRPIGDILLHNDLYVETQEAVEKYIEDLERFLFIQSQTGLQLNAEGTAQTATSDRWYGRTDVYMTRDGRPTKVVVDDPAYDENARGKSDSTKTLASFWRGDSISNDYFRMTKAQIEKEKKLAQIEKESEDFEVETDDSNGKEIIVESVILPLHQYLRVFDLEKHAYVICHINNLKDYPWDNTLFDKLILPDEQKTLIQMLVQNTGESVSDIIKGKMNGVIVLATGSPGVGKTLTAEVFSETIKKPLYSVQCSQLGLSVDSVEKNLTEILSRAQKWGAILLIDEADVYIRERGDDIVQNAIVGVFLRVLEYYRGVLFMTSNRGNIIDDAIMSRATAWIRYEYPNTEESKKIWYVLSDQYEAELSHEDIAFLSSSNGLLGISGRTIRNILKLARLLAKKEDKSVDRDLIMQVSNYQKLENQKY